MAERDRPHIIVAPPNQPEPYTAASTARGNGAPPFQGDRLAHGIRLREQLTEALDESARERDEATGTFVSFESFPGLELALESLESTRKGAQPELIAVKDQPTTEGSIQIATVFIPEGKKGFFLKKLSKYVETVDDEKAGNAALVEGIESIRRATIQALWTEPATQFPADMDEARWWEVWLRRLDGQERARFGGYAEAHSLRTSSHYLGFGDRTVLLVRATARQLADAFASVDDMAELRQPHEVAHLLTESPPSEQREWVENLRDRTRPAAPGAPAVCLLDTGVQSEHPLLAGSISKADVHVADARWPVPPVSPHGTEMAGLALFGDLQEKLLTATTIHLRHRLESVKLLPDRSANDRDLYGALTARGVDRPEIEAADRGRVFMLAVTAPREPAEAAAGRPTSWSAAIDALAYGRAIDDSDSSLVYLDRDEARHPRLFIVSAGNIRDPNPVGEPLDRSDTEPVEDPAQSWNAITVGAIAGTDDMSGAPEGFEGYMPMAPRGELSPSSRTSVMFEGTSWPLKPDVVADGGNLAVSPDRTLVDTPPNLGLLTTRFYQPGGGYFTTTRDTSAATAQVAAIASDIMAAYPALRPETVRALVVHSAQWTPAMTKNAEGSNFSEKRRLVQRYGMGVPDADRALRSATDALTLITEASLRPFEREGESSSAKTREMNLHKLPWPLEELEALGETKVRMRVTLSYFIEPNPSARGWKGRYAYPSHGLRFAMKRPEDSLAAFQYRINKRTRGDQSGPPSLGTEKGWYFGRNHQEASGSIHSDIWTGSAADLASKGAIAVYPVAGWWRSRPALDQSDDGVDYSLVVSIESPEVETDLWTPVAAQVGLLVPVAVGTDEPA